MANLIEKHNIQQDQKVIKLNLLNIKKKYFEMFNNNNMLRNSNQENRDKQLVPNETSKGFCNIFYDYNLITEMLEICFKAFENLDLQRHYDSIKAKLALKQ